VFGLLVIFGQFWGEPWYGKNAGLMKGLPTGLHYVQLTWCYLLSVPGPIATQRHSGAVLNLLDEPQRAGSRHDQTQRVGTEDALVLATLILPQASEGVGVTKSNFNGMITNDKFCCIRWGTLPLSWWRRPLRLRS
jgi:hypothetical protein